MSDVARFDRLAVVYDWFAPSASLGDVRAGLAYAERDVESVLDLAGGTGRTADALRERSDANPDLDVTVLDAARGMLREARAKDLPVVRGDATRLPVADASVDAVVATDALHHLDAPAAIRERRAPSGPAACSSRATSTRADCRGGRSSRASTR
ncbi:class I SAM-dependent methyltransferase [Halarchaeum acidiphilum]|uniref:class I SAM-dependent methyltransferase n=1 Tax=Halarchaeum acidiphilum TaxID=489138 RepID=UPI001F25F418|nr:class I SAM-dependent methyltransferase [Halarchaeum acidiphilum]